MRSGTAVEMRCYEAHPMSIACCRRITTDLYRRRQPSFRGAESTTEQSQIASRDDWRGFGGVGNDRTGTEAAAVSICGPPESQLGCTGTTHLAVRPMGRRLGSARRVEKTFPFGTLDGSPER
jgi:hypothetical protein